MTSSGPTATRRAPRLSGMLVVTLALSATLLGVAGGSAAGATGEDDVAPGAARPVAAYVQLKLAEGTGVRLRGQRFTATGSSRGAALDAVVQGTHPDLIRPTFTQRPRRLAADVRLARGPGSPVADLTTWYRLRYPSLQAADRAVRVLSGVGVVEHVGVEAPPAPLPVSADYVGLQGYRGSPAEGIGADLVAGIPGADGTGVTVIDVEYSWNPAHEDLTGAQDALLPNGTPCDPFSDTDHGTAVLGELGGDPNGFGVTGLVPGAQLGMVNAARVVGGSCWWDLANAVNQARLALDPGDVILVEQQVVGPLGGSNYVPVEWDPASYDAITLATASGIVVVEAAGNGSQDLDDTTLFGSPFPAGRPDSGAIIVGAGEVPGCGSQPARSRASFSTHGARVDLQGWGECVTTTGYGSLGDRSDPNAWYTSSFNGTSSASPIVAGAAAAVLGAHEARTGTALSPRDLRDLLVRTGSAQYSGAGGLAGHIGPLPDLAAALGSLVPTDPRGPNLLRNPGFERDADGDRRPDRWTATGRFTRSSARAYTGTYAGRHLASDGARETVTQVVASLSPSTGYRFSGQVDVPTTADSFTVRIRIRWRDRSNDVIRTDLVRRFTSATGGWEQARRTVTSPAGAARAQVQAVAVDLDATVYVDDFWFGRA